MRDYFNSKFTRIKRHFDQVINVHVILSVEKIHHKAEATMHINSYFKVIFSYLSGLITGLLTHIQNRDVRLLIITIIFTGMVGFAAQMVWSQMRYGLL